MHVFVTGANGFLGTALVARGAAHSNIRMHLLAREAKKIPTELLHHPWQVGDVQSLTPEDLRGMDAIIHTAAKVHDPSALDEEYLIHNEQATRHLIQCAVKAGVRRFVFVSTIKVNGEHSVPGKPFTPEDKPTPHGAYAVSKWKSEQVVKQIAEQNNMEWIIVRPPLVYGPTAKGNLQKLRNMIERGLPLPVGAIHNQRSFIGVDNLAEALWQMVSHPQVANRTFLIRDMTLSTPELVQKMAKAMDKNARLVPVPLSLIRLGCVLLGKKDAYTRLVGSLEVDDSDTRQALNWQPHPSF